MHAQMATLNFSSYLYYSANDSAPYQFYQKYSCDYVSYLVPPALAARNPAPAGGVCGVSGYVKGDVSTSASFSSDTQSTLGGCYFMCSYFNSDCLGFAFGSGSCFLYDSKLKYDVTADSNSPYTFYDMNCLTVVAASATSSAPSTNKTSA
jgi:hypothetical protein